MKRVRVASLLLLPLLVLLPVRAQETPTNRVEALQARLERGEVKLTYDPAGNGYVRSLLAALDIPEESQVLPFTRSSFLANLISPASPRAVYFNDDVAVGVARGGRLIEIIVNDKSGGPAFYSFATAPTEQPRFQPEVALCTFCHNRTSPAASLWIVANIPAQANGAPLLNRSNGDFDLTDHATAFENRWGGWYVTGTTGAMRHRGNVTLMPGTKELPIDQGLNVTDLAARFDTAQVLQPSSDVVALMTLEHQAGFINRASTLNADYTQARADELADYMTFAGETSLPGPIKGNSAFAARFAAMGPRDAAGRSLRDHDLQTRLFRFSLSYMIHSDAFASLSPQAKSRIWQRLEARLRPTAEGRAAMAIAAHTGEGAPPRWKTP
jgi:hypothetical protein